MTPQLDRVDRWRVALAIVSLMALVSIVVIAAHDDAGLSQTQSINGDMLGQDNDETAQHYLARAEDSVSQAPKDKPVFGLITWTTPLSSREAAPLLHDIPRVNALVLGTIRPLAIPEPTGDEDRATVMNRYISYASGLLQGTVYENSERLITGVVVYTTGDQLRALKKKQAVYAVETLPQGAQWNSFGVQPVKVPQ